MLLGTETRIGDADSRKDRTIRRWKICSVLLGLTATLALPAGCASPIASSVTEVAGTPSASVDTAAVASTATASASRSTTSTPEAPTVFAVVSDFGEPGEHERVVAALIASWRPAFVVAGGDNYHPDAGGRGDSRYNRSLGTYYRYWIKRNAATSGGASAETTRANAFFPAMGNHDWREAKPAPRTYTDYFDLPGAGFTSTSGNERYYDFVQGPIHFFILDSNREEPDGTSSTSIQAKWLQRQLAASTSTWNVVVSHHPPYSSGTQHGSAEYMRWPFAAWGADVVISGHNHLYERVMRDGIVYFVVGLGGEGDRGWFNSARKGTAMRYRDGRGAQKVTVTKTALEFQFYNAKGTLIDSYRVPAAPGK